jgi:hypothetical protein
LKLCCCCCTLSYLECLCDSLCIKQLYITNFPSILLFMFEFVFYLCTLFSFIKVLFHWIFLAKVFNEADRFLYLGFGLVPPSFFCIFLFYFHLIYFIMVLLR